MSILLVNISVRLTLVCKAAWVSWLTPGLSATLRATWKAAENVCLERRNSIRPCVPSHVAYKAERDSPSLRWTVTLLSLRSAFHPARRRHYFMEWADPLPGGDPRLDGTQGHSYL